jgi:hypothetical protein
MLGQLGKATIIKGDSGSNTATGCTELHSKTHLEYSIRRDAVRHRPLCEGCFHKHEAVSNAVGGSKLCRSDQLTRGLKIKSDMKLNSLLYRLFRQTDEIIKYCH